MVSREKHTYYILLPLITAIIGLIIFSYLLYLTLFSKSQKEKYENPVVASRVLRGTIYDRNGKIIAIETPYYSCALLLRETQDLNKSAQIIGSIVNLDPAFIVREASKNQLYYQVKRRLSYQEHEQLKNINLKGMVLEKRYGRSYPQHYHGGQVVGFTDGENQGIEGLERVLNSYLSPYPNLNESITYGSDVYLTLDLDLQYLLDQEVINIDKEHKTETIVALILDAKTGEILASSSFPFFDPNYFNQSSVDTYQNRVISTMYEPGSVFKVFSLGAVLSNGNNNNLQDFYCDGSYTFSMGNTDATINCVSAHGLVDFEKMLAVSCNGAVAHWALNTNDKQFYSVLSSFGFGKKVQNELSGESSGILKHYDSWSARSKSTIAFGQEVGVTALQIASGATVFANEGDLLHPYIIKEIRDSNGNTVLKNERKVAFENVLENSVVQTVLDGMHKATLAGGTAIYSSVEGLNVASKTGTAQIADLNAPGYSGFKFLASTLSLVPYENPKYVIYMGALNPSGSTIWGSNITSPAIGSLIANMIRQGKLQSQLSEIIVLN
ncbi:MAG: penicillin-binding protein 2 [Sphaerochaetaceae bacterium]